MSLPKVAGCLLTSPWKQPAAASSLGEKKIKKKIKHISLIFKGKPLEMEERRKVEKNLTPIKKKNNPYLLMLEIVYQPCKTETSAFNRLFVLLKEKSIALKSFNIHEIKLLLTYT